MTQRKQISTRKDWLQSIIRFVELMPAPEVLASMEKAIAKRGNSSSAYAFRYFCGICWGKIKEAT